MFKFKNEQPPEAKEKKIKETIARLEKRKFAYESATLGGTVFGALTGVFATAAAVEASAVSPVVGVGSVAVAMGTLLTAVPVVARDIVNLRLKALQKKVMRTPEEILKEQKERIALDNRTGSNAEQDEHVYNVYTKALAKAKVEGKGKTIQRLMNVASKWDEVGHVGAYAGVPVSLLQAGSAAFMNKMQNICAYVGFDDRAELYKEAKILCAVASGYEAIKSVVRIVRANKEMKAGKKAFKILENYVKEEGR
jgi:hypothetical protein